MTPALSLPLLLLALPAQIRFVSEEVRFQSGTLSLAGTLRRPSGGGRVPGVVLVHGSGRTDRSTLRAYADAFERLGLATLVYGKRGVGQSEGPEFAWRDFSFPDLAADRPRPCGTSGLGRRSTPSGSVSSG